MFVLVTFQTFNVPFQGWSVLMSTDWLTVNVPPRFGSPGGAAGGAASARARWAPPPSVAIAAAVPASARPVLARNRRREIVPSAFLDRVPILDPPLARLTITTGALEG